MSTNSLATLNITSDSLSIDNNNSSANFKGGVTVLFDDMILKTAVLKVYYDQNNDKKSIIKIEIPGKLKVTKSCNNEVIIADHGEYLVALNELTLYGHVVIRKDKNMVVADKMIYVTKYKEHYEE